MENTTLRQRINVNGRHETQNDADNLYKITVKVPVHFVTSTLLGLTNDIKPMTLQKLSLPSVVVPRCILSLPFISCLMAPKFSKISRRWHQSFQGFQGL